jgi:hypothetical protein
MLFGSANHVLSQLSCVDDARASPGSSRSTTLDVAVVVAVPPMGMVEMASDEVVDVVTVWHRFVAASGAVCVVRRVFAARVCGGAGRGVGGADIERALVHVPIVRVVEVAVVEVVDVVAVLDGDVAAVGTVGVIVVVVDSVAHPASFLWRGGFTRSVAWSTAFLTRSRTWSSASV